MSKKYILIVMLVLIGALAASAFGSIVKNGTSLQLSRDTDAARYAAMDRYYAAKSGVSLQLSRDADAARYTAMAKYYAAKDVANLQGSRSAVDTSDFFSRHLKLSTSGSAVDTSDFFFRHPELFTFGNAAQQVSSTVYYGPPGR